MRSLWGLDQTLLAACGASCLDHDDVLRDYAVFVAKHYADRPAGYLDAIEDEMMRMIAGLGALECTGNLVFDEVPQRVSRADAR